MSGEDAGDEAIRERVLGVRDIGVRAIGVYVHFPWCLRKCPYCDFASYDTDRESIPHDDYADRVLEELRLREPVLQGRRVESLFFGGGTPSLWRPDALGRVVRAVQAYVRESGGSAGVTFAGPPEVPLEVTVECNPSSLDAHVAAALADQGVNRLSIGVQSLDVDRLRFLGRLHDPVRALAAVDAAVAAMSKVGGRASADYIFAVAMEGREHSPTDATSEVQRIVDCGVDHLSAYNLTIESGTQFGERARRGRLPIATEDSAVDSFTAIEALLGSAGFRHYETSNYARVGCESRHNLGTWRGQDYLGLGAGAVGMVEDGGEDRVEDGTKSKRRRYRNLPLPVPYSAAVRQGELPEESHERLDAETLLRERIMLGLRLEEGFDATRAAQELGIVVWTPARASVRDRLLARGDLQWVGDRLRVSPARGMFADGVAASLF
jgi:putative oxygen-independent coproporphyrinogen III oxidase